MRLIWQWLRALNQTGVWADDGGLPREGEGTDDMPPDEEGTPPRNEPGVNDRAAEQFANEWTGASRALRETMEAFGKHLSTHHGQSPSTPSPAPAPEPEPEPESEPEVEPELPAVHWWWRELRRKRG